MTAAAPRDHGGGLDAAIASYGGKRAGWIDLSTGINPLPWRLPALADAAWTDLPDRAATKSLEKAARRFWRVPKGAAVLAAPGASSLIAGIPALLPAGRVVIPFPTYNEHAAAFRRHRWTVAASGEGVARVAVHPNNPDGRMQNASDLRTGRPRLLVIDESFADTVPDASLIGLAEAPGTIVLKSFGKFWGLAGLRLGFAIGDPVLIERLAEALGPWPVSGPALALGAAALADTDWATRTRHRLATDATRLDTLATGAGMRLLGGTTLFRLYDAGDAAGWQHRLAGHRIWSRVFPYDPRWLRLGLPDPGGWDRLERAL